MAPLTYSWLDGTLVSSTALHRTLVDCALGPHEDALARGVRQLRAAHRRAGLRLGPASGSLAVWTHLAAPMAQALGWIVEPPEAHTLGGTASHAAVLRSRTSRRALLAALPWGVVSGVAMRPLCRLGLDRDIPLVMLTNGRRWICRDARRPLGRQHAGLDLDAAHLDERVWEALWLLAHVGRDHLAAMARLTVTLDATATTAVRKAVGDARLLLARLLGAADDEVLTHIFRWLFLLFAEARGLVPVDNPIYRDAYAVTTIARHARDPRPPFGLWDGLLASAGLAHDGSRHPLLRMTALNGRLFDPDATPRARRRRVPDGSVAPMLTALTTVRTGTREHPIAFGDLDVEHLGTIYEDVLATGASPGVERKRTGTFYTPRDLADHLVAATLGPLVEGRSAAGILALRVLDPAAGSGAILASAARYLHAALEAAWVREGRGGALDVPPGERRDAIRQIVEHCLYGVDAHGRAVQVARLSLWLASMTRERPLTFLDHHLRQGNSLVGSSPADVVTRSPTVAAARAMREGQARLFELDAWDAEAAQLALAFTRMTAVPSDTADAVRAKTQTFRALRDDPLLVAWRRRADAWCAALMRTPMLTRGMWLAVDACVQAGSQAASPAVARMASELQQEADAIGCFHWTLEFPEIFHGSGPGGFDAVLANPPWEMLRADTGDGGERARLRRQRAAELRFVARCGLYSDGGTAHRNLHQLFVERMLQLCRPGGRLGLIAPWGLLGDHGSAAARARLLGGAALDRVSVFDNRRAIFPIHRSVRFVAATATIGRPTTGVAMCPPVESLESLPEHAHGTTAVWIDDDLLHLGSGPGRAFPCVRTNADVAVLRRILAAGVRLGDPPWSMAFGRELNATDDRHAISRRSPGPDTLRVIGGRHLRPFGLDVELTDASLPAIRRRDVEARLPGGSWRHWRLAYRDVSSAGNRWTLIAALVPAGVVTTHTVFILRHPPALPMQLYLCAVLNSLVANWFVRLYIGTHVTSALMARLPVPLPHRTPCPPGTRGVPWRRLARAAARLRRIPAAALEASDEYLRLQAEVARLYGLSRVQMEVILAGTPHLGATARAAILERVDPFPAA